MNRIDIEKIRIDTPGCAVNAHFNNAGCSLPPETVLNAHVDYLILEATIGGYEAAVVRSVQLDRFYSAAAELIGADANEIALTRGASESWWRAFLSVPLKPGDRVLASTSEFVSAAIGLIQARRKGIQVDIVPDDANGVMDLDALREMLDDSVKLVCLTQLPMSNGLINPAIEAGKLVKSVGAYYLVDACQAVGQLPVNVGELQCDFLTATGRKWLRAMRGTGFLYVKSTVMDSLNEPTFIDGRAADWYSNDDYRLEPTAKRFELGEITYASKLGLATAIDYALDLGIDNIAKRIGELSNRLRSGLQEIDSVTVHDLGIKQSGIVTFNVADITSSDVSDILRAVKINTAAPGARNARLNMECMGVESVVRASVHYFNTEEEVDRLLDEVGKIALRTK